MEEQTLDGRVEGLARELARTINGGAAESREQLREFAIELIRDGVITESQRDEAAVTPAVSGFNPFGVAIPLGLASALLFILFPPVGLLLFMAALFMAGWGIVATILTRR
jgi:hypothetical protein